KVAPPGPRSGHPLAVPVSPSQTGVTQVPRSTTPLETGPERLAGRDGSVTSRAEISHVLDRRTKDLPATEPGPRPAAAGAARPRADLRLDEADRLFAARRYDEAERGYAALARQNGLPPDRRPHWAYCRWWEVIRRINGRPRSDREWDEIEAEVRSIQ